MVISVSKPRKLITNLLNNPYGTTQPATCPQTTICDKDSSSINNQQVTDVQNSQVNHMDMSCMQSEPQPQLQPAQDYCNNSLTLDDLLAPNTPPTFGDIDCDDFLNLNQLHTDSLDEALSFVTRPQLQTPVATIMKDTCAPSNTTNCYEPIKTEPISPANFLERTIFNNNNNNNQTPCSTSNSQQFFYADNCNNNINNNNNIIINSNSTNNINNTHNYRNQLINMNNNFGNNSNTTVKNEHPGMDATAVEVYRDLILTHLLQDIQNTCCKLFISSDPYSWNNDHSALWVEEMCRQLQLDTSPVNLYVSGCELCAMSVDEWVNRAPGCGEPLHAQLQIWKTAEEFADTKRGRNIGTFSNNNNNVQFCNQSQQVYDGGHVDNSFFGDQLPQLTNHQMNISKCSDEGNTSESFPCNMTLSEWLSSFDPNQCNMGPSTSLVGPHNNSIAQLLNSPSASDSGISADYEEFSCDNFQALPIEHQPQPASIVNWKRRRQTAPGGKPSRATGHTIHLWQFLRELLDAQLTNVVRWVDRAEGVFKIENSHELAKLWGQRKNRTKMNYDKLSRSLRQYYKKGIIKKTGQRQRLIYQFIPPYNLD